MRGYLLVLAMLCISLTGISLTACRGKSAATPSASPTSIAVQPTATPTVPRLATPAATTVITAANASSLRATDSFKGTTVQRLAWSTNGAVLWIVGTRTVDEMNANTGDTKRMLEVQDPERVLAVLPTGIAVIAAAQGSPVRLLDLTGGQTVRTLDPGGAVFAATSFRGDRLVLVSGDKIVATVWDVTSGQQVATLSGFQTAAPVFNVMVDNAGDRAAWVSRGTLQFEDVRTNTLGARVSFEDFIGAYAFSADGRTFATTTGAQVNGTLGGRLQLWDPATGAEVLRMTQPALFAGLAYASVQPLIATGGDGFVLWSTTDGKRAGGASVADAGSVRLLSFSPDGTVLATVDDAGKVVLWRAG